MLYFKCAFTLVVIKHMITKLSKMVSFFQVGAVAQVTFTLCTI